MTVLELKEQIPRIVELWINGIESLTCRHDKPAEPSKCGAELFPGGVECVLIHRVFDLLLHLG